MEGRGQADLCRPRRRAGRRLDTANPISGHYLMFQPTVDRGVEDGWRDQREAEGEVKRVLGDGLKETVCFPEKL